MLFLYNVLLLLLSPLVSIAALFSPKIKLFVAGRKTVFATLAAAIEAEDQTIWFHAASLGEFEQGLPVMEQIKLRYPGHKIVLSFFSPSGFEVRKNNTVADVTVYLPIDTKANAQKFLQLVHPELVFFIKYEYWPNYLQALKKAGIATYLISGIFRENQAFFKWYGGFYREALKTFAYFFVQNEGSKRLLQSIGHHHVAVSGDTRFDRVVQILERDNRLDFMAAFKNEQRMIVIGSSWPKDEALLAQYINQSASDIKFVIAPHNIKAEQLQALQQSIFRKTVLYSEKEGKPLADFQVFIIDTIGILTKIYSYADLAYVGGGFGQPGVHNLLEPATFGIPIVLGPNYSHFAEATALVHLEGCISIKNLEELQDAFDQLLANADIRHEKGHICGTFVQMNKGATDIILKYLQNQYD